MSTNEITDTDKNFIIEAYEAVKRNGMWESNYEDVDRLLDEKPELAPLIEQMFHQERNSLHGDFFALLMVKLTKDAEAVRYLIEEAGWERDDLADLLGGAEN